MMGWFILVCLAVGQVGTTAATASPAAEALKKDGEGDFALVMEYAKENLAAITEGLVTLLEGDITEWALDTSGPMSANRSEECTACLVNVDPNIMYLKNSLYAFSLLGLTMVFNQQNIVKITMKVNASIYTISLGISI